MTRLDKYLVDNNFYVSRMKAKYAIENGCIYINDSKIKKCSYDVQDNDVVEVKDIFLPYVSKGGLKLEKAILDFKLSLKAKKMIDIGSSTGGFSDCAIQNGIDHIVAIDVGSKQFNSDLLKTKKIDLFENTDFRNIDNNIINNYDLATIDVSFISVTKLLNKLNEIKVKEIVLLIKPQFECGKEIADKYKGIILDKEVHNIIINNIIKSFNDIGYGLKGLTTSPIRGGNGNIEYLAYFILNENNNDFEIEKIINNAFKNN